LRSMDGDGEQKKTIVKCPHCGARVEIAPQGLGRVHRCECGGQFRAPGGKPPRALREPGSAAVRLSPMWRSVLNVVIASVLGFGILTASLYAACWLGLWPTEMTDPGAPTEVQRSELSMDELITQLSDRDRNIGGLATRELVRRGESAIEPLMLALHSKDFLTCSNAQQALVRIGEPALPSLIEALAEEDTRVATWVAWALGDIGDPRAAGPLLREFEEHIAMAASPIRPFASTAELDADQRKHHVNAANAMARALGELRASEAADALSMALGTIDPSLDQTIAEALKRMGVSATPAIERAGEQSQDPRERG